LRRRLVICLLAIGLMVVGFSGASAVVAPQAEAAPARVCTALLQKARALPVLAQVGAAAVTGACLGDAYSQSWWWNRNFDRIYNRCWPNCSNWDLTRMILGIPG
jgi:hypothetical protein